jgi:hypothetical protein
MEIGQGPNWGCSAIEKKITNAQKDPEYPINYMPKITR